MLCRVPEGVEREKGREIIEEIMGENFQSFMKNMTINIREAPQNPSMRTQKRPTETYDQTAAEQGRRES